MTGNRFSIDDPAGHPVVVDVEHGALSLTLEWFGVAHFPITDPATEPRVREDARRSVHAVAAALLAAIGLQAPVDWSTVRPGDPDPTVRTAAGYGYPVCGRYFGGADGTRWTCGRYRHDDEVHVAGTTDDVIAVLRADGTLLTRSSERELAGD